jgi:hypothetical protein
MYSIYVVVYNQFMFLPVYRFWTKHSCGSYRLLIDYRKNIDTGFGTWFLPIYRFWTEHSCGHADRTSLGYELIQKT